MKCLCVINKYWPSVGGSEMHTREIMQRLSKWMSVQVACFSSDTHHYPSNEEAVANNRSSSFFDKNVHTHHFGPSGFTGWLLKALAPYYSRNNIGKALYTLVVMVYAYQSLKPLVQKSSVIHLVYNGMTPIAEVTLRLAKQYKKRVIVTPLLSFGMQDEQSHPGQRMLKVIKKADAVIALTPHEKRYLQSLGVKASVITVIPVGALVTSKSNPKQFLHDIGVKDEKVVLFLSRHVEGKGYHLVAKAMSTVWNRHPDTLFVFLGPKDDSAKKRLSNYKDPRVIQIENDCQQFKSNALAACSLLCVPTYQEGLGGVFIEAWCYKKPVVSGEISVLNDVISNGQDGYLVPHSKQAIANAINNLLDKPQHAQQLGEFGYQKTINKYSWSVISKKIHSLYVTSTPTLISRG